MQLLVLEGPDRGKLITLRAHVTGGTDPRCDFQLSDRTVSRQHFRVIRDGHEWELHDCESLNGTKVHGLHVKGAISLRPGTVFSVGQTQILFQPARFGDPAAISGRTTFGRCVGRSARMREVFAQLEKIASSDMTVVLEGDTGTGKGLVAESIHDMSPRANRELVVLDCATLSPTLIESDLFGHERGAFTGATSTRPGAFERAHRGTLFLDEIGELPLDLQAKLLRAVETREVRRVGGQQPIQVDVRMIAATKHDLGEMVEAGLFREDLLFRLSVARITLPPLRDRPEDIPAIIDTLLGGTNVRITDDAMDLLLHYDWPGNVRELRNVLDRAAVMADGSVIRSEDIVLERVERAVNRFPVAAQELCLPYKLARERVLDSFERAYLVRLIHRHGHNISALSREAEVQRKHLRRLLRKHGLYEADLPDEHDDYADEGMLSGEYTPVS